jgi:hexosaminidase
MPAPAEVVASGATFAAGRLVIATDKSNPRLTAALDRARQRWAARVAPAGDAPPLALTVTCEELSPELPALGEDESYTLTLAPGQATLAAATDLGALHGLETLLQLLRAGAGGPTLPAVEIRDHPRFPWRGLMIDVSRRWQPLAVIERNLDAMAVVKLNVLHLHLTDDQGFRIESLTHPELQHLGSDGQYFTQADIRTLVAYAALRGIRLVPEFDIPGHATSWVVSHPEVASLPGPYGIERQWGVFNPVLDPTNEATYTLLADFLGEMAALFPDAFMHIGGDENNGVQWNANPRIQAFIKESGLAGDAGLHAMFNQRVNELLASHGKRLVGWDEIFNPLLPKDCVIDSWRGPEALGQTAVAGLDCILSNGFYIDLCYPASDHYLTEPLPADSPLTAAERAHVLGGEATMWSEWVSPETIDSRIWPRTAAVAERLWSPREVRDVPEMYRRLAIVSDRLTEAGSLHDRNQDLMLRHLVGANLQIPGIESLRCLIALLEPVKHYQRGREQIWCNQLVPLVALADAVRPDSTPSREFADRVEAALFAGAAIDGNAVAALSRQLDAWTSAAREIIDPMSTVYPAVREAIPPANALIAASAVGAQAIDSLGHRRPLTPSQLAAALAALDRAGLPNGSATELPVLKPLRLLAAAAAAQSARAGSDATAWRQLVIATAYPTGLPPAP